MKLNQRGAIDGLFIIALVAVLALGGFIFWQVTSANDAVNESDDTSDGQSLFVGDDSESAKDTDEDSSSKEAVLKITQWKVELVLTPDISDANYVLVNTGAFLSQDSVDKIQACKKDTSPDTPSYQVITQAGLNDQIPELLRPANTTTAKEAAAAQPDNFKEINGYVYYFERGNGTTCQEVLNDVDSFQKAFKTLRAS